MDLPSRLSLRDQERSTDAGDAAERTKHDAEGQQRREKIRRVERPAAEHANECCDGTPRSSEEASDPP